MGRRLGRSFARFSPCGSIKGPRLCLSASDRNMGHETALRFVPAASGGFGWSARFPCRFPAGSVYT